MSTVTPCPLPPRLLVSSSITHTHIETVTTFGQKEKKYHLVIFLSFIYGISHHLQGTPIWKQAVLNID